MVLLLPSYMPYPLERIWPVLPTAVSSTGAVADVRSVWGGGILTVVYDGWFYFPDKFCFTGHFFFCSCIIFLRCRMMWLPR